MAAITCTGVSKTFRIPMEEHITLKGKVLHPFSRASVRQFDALHDISFEIEQGEFFGIVGRNGSGKSTLLKLLAGIYEPSAGRIDVAGAIVPFIELGVGFNPELSGRENLYINGALLGFSKQHLRDRYDAIVAFAELEGFMDLKLRNFSSGMQVRLAFSIGIESGADIMLVDEVLAVGDERFQKKCFDVFRARRRQGRTVVLVTHDMSIIQQFCDRVLLLEQGEVLELADPRTVTRRYHRLNIDEDHDSSVTGPGPEMANAAPTGPASIAKVWLEDLEGAPLLELSPGHEEFQLCAQVVVREQLIDPIVGFILQNRFGQQVLLANNWWSGDPLGTLEPDMTYEVRMRARNVFAAGRIWVTAEVAYADGGDIFESKAGILEFVVDRPIDTGGVIDVAPKFSVDIANANASAGHLGQAGN